jgi:hypothetical protein
MVGGSPQRAAAFADGSTSGSNPELTPQRGLEVLDSATIGRRIRREYDAVHCWVLEAPMSPARLGRNEALALKLAPHFFHLIAGRQLHSPWHGRTGGKQPISIATRG